MCVCVNVCMCVRVCVCAYVRAFVHRDKLYFMLQVCALEIFIIIIKIRILQLHNGTCNHVLHQQMALLVTHTHTHTHTHTLPTRPLLVGNRESEIVQTQTKLGRLL